MYKRFSNYQVLSHNPMLGVFTPVQPVKVLSAQDPYNLASYNTNIATVCKPTSESNTQLLANQK